MIQPQPDFIVANESQVWSDTGQVVDLLRSRRLFKTLSLLVAKAACVKVPPSLLLLDRRRDVIADFAQAWGLPLMIRLDYERSPKQKPLGGIPLYTIDSMYGVSEYLFQRKCLPLFHSNLDRFQDLYSAGVLVTNDNYESEIEIVGKGFDAGDLRRGKTTPHERAAVDLSSGTLKDRTRISDAAYLIQRTARIDTVCRLRAYTDFANRQARLCSSILRFEPSRRALVEQQVPVEYDLMPSTLLKKLIAITQTIRLSVIPALPLSKTYVASMSYLPKEGWMLWDVYGDWYQR